MPKPIQLMNEYNDAMVIESTCNIPTTPGYAGDNTLLAWYDRDRDFEPPRHAGECHVNSAIPGYINYALYHGATL